MSVRKGTANRSALTATAIAVLWAAVLALLAPRASCISQVQRKNGRTFCPGNADNVLSVTPKKPLYGTCIVSSQWNRVSLENLKEGRHYSIRLSYLALRTHVFDLKLEAVLSNGTSVFTSGNHAEVQVVFDHDGSRRGLVGGKGGIWLQHAFSAGSDDKGGSKSDGGAPSAGPTRELLDTHIQFLNPFHDMRDAHVSLIYLHIRIRPQGFPSGDLYDEFGVYSETERPSQDVASPNKADQHAQFYEFDLLVAEKVYKTFEIDIVPILLVCITFFVIMNLYVLRRWHRYVLRAPDEWERSVEARYRA